MTHIRLHPRFKPSRTDVIIRTSYFRAVWHEIVDLCICILQPFTLPRGPAWLIDEIDELGRCLLAADAHRSGVTSEKVSFDNTSHKMYGT